MTVDDLQYDGLNLEAPFGLRNHQRWIAARFAPIPDPKGNTVEFGTGIGAMSQWFAPLVARAELVEHIEDDTSALRALLRPAGHLLVFVPAPYSRRDRLEPCPRIYESEKQLSGKNLRRGKEGQLEGRSASPLLYHPRQPVSVRKAGRGSAAVVRHAVASPPARW